MTFISDRPAEIVVAAVMLCWLSFAAILVAGRKGAAKTSVKREVKSHLGFLLQGIAYGICFAFYRPYFSPFFPMPKVTEDILAGITIAVAVASAWFCYEAARTLGKQWALVARVIEGHQLIRQGPYALVRNPIYLAMLGMLAAIALAVSRWQAAAVAVALFAAGTTIRIRSEEKLLRETFGATFAEYARLVPAFFPRVSSSPARARELMASRPRGRAD